MPPGDEERARFWSRMVHDITGLIVGPAFSGARVRVPERLDLASRFLMLNFGRGFRTFQAAFVLVSKQFVQDGIVLARVLLETSFEMSFVAKRPEDAALYFQHANGVEQRLKLACLDAFPDVLQRLQETGVAFREEQRSTARHGRWHEQFPTIKSRAIEAGVPLAHYEILYALLSRYVHSSGGEHDFETMGYPERVHARDRTEAFLVMWIVCGTMIRMLKLMERCLGLPIKDETDKLSASYDAFVAKEASGDVARGS